MQCMLDTRNGKHQLILGSRTRAKLADPGADCNNCPERRNLAVLHSLPADRGTVHAPRHFVA